MPDLDDIDDQFSIFDRIHNAINALTDPVALLRRQFLASGRTRIISQAADEGHDPLTRFFLGNSLYFAEGGLFYANAIFCHCS